MTDGDLVLTDGDLVLTDGDLVLTDGDLVLTVESDTGCVCCRGNCWLETRVGRYTSGT